MGALLVVTALLISWGMKNLCREQWQILAAVPTSRDSSGSWSGLNLTFYGLFSANAYVAGALLFIIFSGAIGMPLRAIATVTGALLVLCVPASSLIARIVEKKSSVFTVAGGFFSALIILPLIVMIVRKIPGCGGEHSLPLMPLLAASGIAYSYAAGIGTLACMSFGCCYGKPLAACGPLLQKIFAGRCFVFLGETKKISYAHSLDTLPVLPVQALTAVIYTSSAIATGFLFIYGFYAEAFFITVLITQGWRFVSEFIRADYRGGGKLTAYQIMALIAIGYAVIFMFLPVAELNGIAPVCDIREGLRCVWRPDTILLLQVLWLCIFLYTGRSKVTGSRISIFVRRERV